MNLWNLRALNLFPNDYQRILWGNSPGSLQMEKGAFWQERSGVNHLMDIDLQVRLAAFAWLSEQVNSHGDVLPRKLLEQGFSFRATSSLNFRTRDFLKPKFLDLQSQ